MIQPKRETAVIYTRRSTKGEAQQVNSLQDQERECRAYADALGFEVTRVFSDKESGTTADRPGFQAMLDYVTTERGARHVIIHHPDRFGRFQDSDEAASHRWKIKEAGCQIHYAESKRTADASMTNSIINTLEDVTAGEKSRHMSQQTLRGKLSTFQKGSRQGSIPPFGYNYRVFSSEGKHLHDVVFSWTNGELRKDEVSPTGEHLKTIVGPYGITRGKTDQVRLTPHPERATIVKQIFEQARSLGSIQIVHDLNQRGIPSPSGKLWNKASLILILRNPAYTGRMVFNRRTSSKLFRLEKNGERVQKQNGDPRNAKNPASAIYTAEATHPAIIDDQTFAEVQKALDNRSTHAGRHSVADVPFFFTGILKHAACGSPVYARSRKLKTGYSGSYYCASHREHGDSSCKGFYLSKSIVETPLLALLKAYADYLASTTGERLINKVKDIIRGALKSPEHVTQLENDILTKEAELQKITRSISLENLHLLDEELGRRRRELEALKSERSRMTGSSDAIQNALTAVDNFAAELKEGNIWSTPAKVKEAAALIFEKLEVDTENNQINWALTDPQNLIITQAAPSVHNRQSCQPRVSTLG